MTYRVLSGAVSHKPGYLLNSDEKGVEIALVGQTPVKVADGTSIKKGQYCIAVIGGTVKGVDEDDMTYPMSLKSVGIALENSKDNYVRVKVK